MKHFLLAFALFLTAPLLHAQKANEADTAPTLPIDSETHLIAYTSVKEIPDATKEELYARGKVYFANAFKSAQNVIQADDREAGLVIGKAWQQVYISSLGLSIPMKLWYTVKLAFKDGRYRYDVTDFMLEASPSRYNYNPSPIAAERFTSLAKKDGTPTGMASKHIRALDEAAHATITGLEASMSKPAAGGKEW